MAKTPLRRFVASLRPENGTHVDRFLEEKSQVYRTLRSSQFQAWSAQTLARFPVLERFARPTDTTAGHTILRVLNTISDTENPAAIKATASMLGLSPSTPRDEVMATAAATFGYENGRAFERGIIEPFRTANASDNLALRTFVADDNREKASGVGKTIPDLSPRLKEESADAQERRNLIDTYARRAEAARPPFEAAKATLYHPSTERQADVARSLSALSGEQSMVAANSPGALSAGRRTPRPLSGSSRTSGSKRSGARSSRPCASTRPWSAAWSAHRSRVRSSRISERKPVPISRPKVSHSKED